MHTYVYMLLCVTSNNFFFKILSTGYSRDEFYKTILAKKSDKSIPLYIKPNTTTKRIKKTFK